MEIRKKRIISLVRVGIYLFIILYVLLLGKNVYMGVDICPLHRILGVLCPTCGATRAALSLLHLDIKAALDYNPVYTLGVFPIMAIIVIEDIQTVFVRLFSKKHRQSIAERIYQWLLD